MTDNKMTPEQFVEKWLLEYKERRNEFISSMNEVELFYATDSSADEFMLCSYFPEALESFARHVWDQACRDQRADCYDKALEEFANPNGYSIHSVCHAIQNTPAPEFKLTEKE